MGPQTAAPDVLRFSDVEQLRQAAQIIRQEADALIRMSESLSDSFCDAIRLVQGARGRVLVTGVGKAGLIGQKIVATMSSTGTPAQFLHPTEAVHGDLGCADSGDIVVALSNSGQSEEVVRLLPILKQLGIPLVAITRDDQNPLALAADVVLSLGRHAEAGHLALAPSCSTTAMLAMGDALALVLSQARGFTADDFATRHPAGRLGMDLKSVGEVMRTGSQLRIAWELESVREVLVRHNQPGRRTGAVMLVSASGELTGLFTDSDLARLFEKRRDDELDGPIRNVMTTRPTTIQSDARLKTAVHMMSQQKLSELPVVDNAGVPTGLLDITDVLQLVDCEDGSAADTPPPLTETRISLARSA